VRPGLPKVGAPSRARFATFEPKWAPPSLLVCRSGGPAHLRLHRLSSHTQPEGVPPAFRRSCSASGLSLLPQERQTGAINPRHRILQLAVMVANDARGYVGISVSPSLRVNLVSSYASGWRSWSYSAKAIAVTAGPLKFVMHPAAQRLRELHCYFVLINLSRLHAVMRHLRSTPRHVLQLGPRVARNCFEKLSPLVVLRLIARRAISAMLPRPTLCVDVRAALDHAVTRGGEARYSRSGALRGSVAPGNQGLDRSFQSKRL
jgi:hypothetical protein